MVKKTLDSVDLKILRILQDEGRISNLDLSKKISMSPPPTLRRVRDLEDNGYICLLYTSPSPRDGTSSRMPSSA